MTREIGNSDHRVDTATAFRPPQVELFNIAFQPPTHPQRWFEGLLVEDHQRRSPSLRHPALFLSHLPAQRCTACTKGNRTISSIPLLGKSVSVCGKLLPAHLRVLRSRGSQLCTACMKGTLASSPIPWLTRARSLSLNRALHTEPITRVLGREMHYSARRTGELA